MLCQLYPYVLWLVTACWALLFSSSQEIAISIGDAALQPLMEVVSFAFLFVLILSLYRGNFQGHLLMVPGGALQVTEQFVRAGAILVAALSYHYPGDSIYQMGTVVMSGALAGGVLAVLVLWYYNRKILSGSTEYLHQWKIMPQTTGLFKRLMIEGGLVSLYSAFLILPQLIGSLRVKNALMFFGLSDLAAKVDKGVCDRGQPLVQLGLVIASASSSTFLSGLTKYFTKKNRQQFLQVAKISLRPITTLTSAASTGLVMSLPYMNFTLLKDYKGSGVLGVYVLSIAFMAIIQTYQSIEQDRNRFKGPLVAAGVGLLVKLLTAGFFTIRWGTLDASWSTIPGLLATLFVLVRQSDVVANCLVRERNLSKKLLLSLTITMLSLLAYQGIISILSQGVHHRSQAFFVTVLGAIVGGTAFISTIIKLELFMIHEWLSLPYGAKILRMRQKK